LAGKDDPLPSRILGGQIIGHPVNLDGLFFIDGVLRPSGGSTDGGNGPGEGWGGDIPSGKHQSQRPLIGRKRVGGRMCCRVDKKIGTKTGGIVGPQGIDQEAGALSEAKGADHGTGTADNTNRSVISRGNKLHPL